MRISSLNALLFNQVFFYDNLDRLNRIEKMVETYRINGVIHYGIQFCKPYSMESMSIERALKNRNIPTL